MATDFWTGVEDLAKMKYDAGPIPILTPPSPRNPPNAAVPAWNPPPYAVS